MVFGARLGVLPALVAVPAVVLQLALAVLLSRLAVTGFGQVARSRIGSVLACFLIRILSVRYDLTAPMGPGTGDN